MKHRKDIGEIYKDLYSEVELSPDNDLWDLVELKTEKIKFYKFGFSHFNIYYLSTIVVFSILSIYTFIRINSFTSDHSEKNITNNLVAPPSETKVSTASETNDQEMLSQPEKNIKNIIRKSQDQSKIKKDNIVDSDKKSININKEDSSNTQGNKILVKEALPLIKTDSTKDVSKSKPTSVSPTAKAKVNKEPKKRVIYIEQPDTIIVVDTLKGKEARKKRNKLK